ncbi:hypothetical protein BCR33DRAFT_740556 [Rhizoclosmatium globosum]|uniref:Uncharacterized protein n=1 Tax=Rhizoclosmatium globosum TaxID=329046 RepID=A0A1Y2C0L1_9FUNG|nr:hypothetical protein BCR33DRAFT_740556 [Rhizoclosmatium globosum]|eukprot:ORY39855.1 hypothetical protein BCR33DRAFT_740556 [Rhizoclosmatium globosum]
MYNNVDLKTEFNGEGVSNFDRFIYKYTAQTLTPDVKLVTVLRAFCSKAVTDELDAWIAVEEATAIAAGIKVKEKTFDEVRKWMRDTYAARDVIYTFHDLSSLADYVQENPYTLIGEYWADYKEIYDRIPASSAPDENKAMMTFIGGCKPHHRLELSKYTVDANNSRSKDWVGFSAAVVRQAAIDRQLVQLGTTNGEVARGADPFAEKLPAITRYVRLTPKKPPAATYPTTTPSAGPTTTTPASSVDELTRMMSDLTIKISAGVPMDQINVPQYIKNMYLAVVSSVVRGAPAPAVPGLPAQGPSVGGVSAAAGTQARPSRCLFCDRQEDHCRRDNVKVHRFWRECPDFIFACQNGWPCKEVKEENGRSRLSDLAGNPWGSNYGKGGIKALIERSMRPAGSTNSVRGRIMMTKAAAPELVDSDLLDMEYALFDDNGKVVLLHNGVAHSLESVMSLCGVDNVTHDEADEAFCYIAESMKVPVEELEVTCQDVSWAVSRIRAEAFAKRSREPEEVVGPAPKRLPVTRSNRFMPLSELGSSSSAPPVAAPVPPVVVPPPAAPAPAPPSGPVPLGKPEKRAFRMGKTGPVTEIKPDDVYKGILNTDVTLKLVELLAISPGAAKYFYGSVKTHRMYDVDEPQPIPMAVDSLMGQPGSAANQMLMGKILSEGPSVLDLPSAVVGLLRANADRVLPSSEDKERLVKVMVRRNGSAMDSVDSQYTRIGEYKARVMSVGSRVQPFDPKVQYSTHGSPHFYDVVFQDGFVVLRALGDSGSEMNVCSFRLAQDSASQSIVDRNVVMFMYSANGSESEIYGMIRDAKIGFRGGVDVLQKVYIAPKADKSPFALLLGMPTLISTRSSSVIDTNGNMWHKLTSPITNRSIQVMTCPADHPRNQVEPVSRDKPMQAEQFGIIERPPGMKTWGEVMGM